MRYAVRIIISTWLMHLLISVLPRSTPATRMAIHHIEHACTGMIAELDEAHG